MIPELATNVIELSRVTVQDSFLDKYCQGSTFVLFQNVIDLHLVQTYDNYGKGLINLIDQDGKSIQCQKSMGTDN